MVKMENYKLPVSQFGASSKGLHLGLLLALLVMTAPSHSSHLPEATSLVRRLLHPGGVDQVEGALVLIVVVGVLAAGSKLGRVLVCK